MKRPFTILLLLSLVSLSFANDVTKKESIAVAKSFFYEHINQFSPTSFETITVDHHYLVQKNNITVYHVVNFAPTGYVIVTANKSLTPVLAYSFSSQCLKQERNVAFLWWMDHYTHQIMEAQYHQLLIGRDIHPEWDRLLHTTPDNLSIKKGRAVAPLIKSKWNQDKYYNGACPEDPQGPGGHAYAGCVPTAIGQVMYYYRWPLQGAGSYSYLDSTYGIQAANFGATNYHWDGMPMSLNNENDDIAQLLYHIGVSCDLHYGPNGSGMNNHKAGYSFRTFFNYVDSTRYIFRDSVAFDWRTVLINHLDRKMPLYYAGWSDTIHKSGHAFVCDGYQDTNFFHFNWGWGGSQDGYFNIDNLTPGGSNFTLMHEAVINCYPDTAFAPYPYYCTGNKTLTSLDGSVTDGSGPVNDYNNNISCSWLISPQGDSIENITLSFYEFETHSPYDYLIVYDGNNNTSPVIGTFYGSNIPPAITSSGTELYLEFSTDSAGSAAGFIADYKSNRVSFCNLMEIVTATQGTISDGSGTFNYHNNKICRWYIQPAAVGAFNLAFTHFDVDSSDFLKIFDDQNNLVATLKGKSVPAPMTIYSSKIVLIFTANATETAEGWSMQYTTSPVGVNEQKNNVALNLFPNPVKNMLNISYSGQPLETVSIYTFNLMGELIGTFSTTTDKNGNLSESINFESYANGCYILKVVSANRNYFLKVIHE